MSLSSITTGLFLGVFGVVTAFDASFKGCQYIIGGLAIAACLLMFFQDRTAK